MDIWFSAVEIIDNEIIDPFRILRGVHMIAEAYVAFCKANVILGLVFLRALAQKHDEDLS